MVTVDDIQVFVPTYHRPDLLPLTIESLLDQSVPVKRIVVLDNGAFDETVAVVGQYADRGVVYEDTSSLGRMGNMLAAQQLLDCKYTILLHDDDQVHEDYLKTVVDVINAHDQINLVTCRVQPWEVDGARAELKRPHVRGHVFTQQQYTTFVHNSGHSSFSLAVYAAEAFKSVDIQGVFDTYGKWCDIPLLIEAVEGGVAAVLMDRWGWMGEHSGQDSHDLDSRPSYQSWLNRERLFYDILGDDPRTLAGLSFCLMNYRHLRSGYKRRVRQDVSMRQYFEEAMQCCALTKRGKYFRFVSPKLVQKFFLKRVEQYYQKTARDLV